MSTYKSNVDKLNKLIDCLSSGGPIKKGPTHQYLLQPNTPEEADGAVLVLPAVPFDMLFHFMLALQKKSARGNDSQLLATVSNHESAPHHTRGCKFMFLYTQLLNSNNNMYDVRSPK